MTSATRWRLCFAAAIAAGTPGAGADPGGCVVTAYPDAGVRTLDLRHRTAKHSGAPQTVWPEVGFAYGVNSRWTTELFTSGVGLR